MSPIEPAEIYSALAPWLIALNVVLALLLVSWMERSRRLVAQANEYRERYAATIENLAEGVYLRSLVTGKMISVNKTLVSICGHDSGQSLLDDINDPDHKWYVDPARAALFQEQLCRDGYINDFVSQIYRFDTGERLWITEQARIIYDEKTGKPLFYAGSVRDITPEIRQKQTEERLEKLANNLPGGLFQLERRPDGSFACTYFSDSFASLFGLDRPYAKVDPNAYLTRIVPKDLPAYMRSLHRSAEDLSVWNQEFRCKLVTGVTVWLLVTATPEPRSDGTIIWHGYVKDISERKLAESRIHHLAYFDSLTDLPNRRQFTERLDKAALAARRLGEYGALLFLDLDNFKALNDTLGHEKGDILLRKAARRLRASVRERDVVARFGGDEFVVLIDDLGPDRNAAEEKAGMVANNILERFRQEFDLDGAGHVATPSIGAVIFDGRNRDAQDLVRDADLAMYEAKKGGRNNFVIFDREPDFIEEENRRASA